MEIALNKVPNRFYRLSQALEKSNFLDELAEKILFEMALIAPELSGRLKASGFAFVGKKLVAESAEVMPGKRGEYDLPTIIGDETTITIVFSTPKPAREGAKVYKVSASGKVFDYAYKILHEVYNDQHLEATLRSYGTVKKVQDLVYELMVNELRYGHD